MEKGDSEIIAWGIIQGLLGFFAILAFVSILLAFLML